MTAPLQYGAAPASDPTAVMGRRVLAWLADLVLFSAVVLAGFASMSEYTEIPPGVAETDACDLFEQQHPDAADTCIAYDGDIYLLDTGEAGVQTLLSFGWFAFFVVLQGFTGGSPGKLLFGLRVVDEHGDRCGIGRSLGRTLLWIVDAAPWIVPLVGPITAFTSTGHRRVGDLAAGTYVVASSSVGTPVGAAAAGAPGSQAPWGAPPPVPGQWAPPTAPPTGPPTTGAGWPPPTQPEVTEPATGWQAPSSAEPSPFAAPGADPASPSAPPPTTPPAEAPQATAAREWPAPQWDQARGTYLQWDPNRQAWLQWDTARQQWKPIDT